MRGQTREFLSEDATAPYTASFIATQTGNYVIIARVVDSGGLAAEKSVIILVNNESPQVSWVSPVNGAVFDPAPASITLTAHATDPDGTIADVVFWSNGLIGQDTTADAQGNYSVTWTNPPTGTNGIYAYATDNDGYETGALISINVGPAPTPTPVPTPTPTPTPIGQLPTVQITSPASNTTFPTGTSVTVVADAQDPGGTITRVDFYHQSYAIYLGSDDTPPYTVSVSSRDPDVKVIFATATDNSGNAVDSASIRIIWLDPDGNLSLSGKLRHEQSTPNNEIVLPNALVELQLHNQLLRTTHTDTAGNYNFGSLSFGGEYTVRPAEPNYTFGPPSATWAGLVENDTQDFIAAGPLPPGPTPTPTPGANVVDWEKFYNSPNNLADYDPRMAVDGQGNTLVTGTSIVPGSSEDTDISTVKYDPAGQQLWARTFAGVGNYKDWATDIAVDAAGNVYICGSSWRGSAFSYDLVTIKYSPDGTEQWVRYLNGPLGSSDFANALALDTGGNVIVTGYDRTRDATTGRNFDEFVTVKYAPDGTELWVSRRSEAQIGDHAIAVTVDASGNSFVTGFAWTDSGNAQSKDIVTVKYSPTGQELWAARYVGDPGTPGPLPLPNNPIGDEPGGIGLDPAGNVYVFGSTAPGTAQDDFLLLKYDPATGALTWARNWSGPAYDYALDMAIDATGNVYLTGESYDIVFQDVNDSPSSDAATVKFAPDGTLLWARIYRAFPGKWDGGRQISLDFVGNIYVGVYSEGFANSDTAVIKYQPDGTEAWVYRYDNPNHSDDRLSDMTADASGNLYLAGDALILNANNVETSDFVTAKLAATSANLNSPPTSALVETAGASHRFLRYPVA